MNDVEKAYKLAKEAHKGQKRRDGSKYFDNHVVRVYDYLVKNYELMMPESKKKEWFDKQRLDCVLCAALLHDVVEDYKHTKVSFEDLKKEFPFLVYELVELLTRVEGQAYFDYIMRIRDSDLFVPAALIKLSDLYCNMEDANDFLSCSYSKYLFSQYILRTKLNSIKN